MKRKMFSAFIMILTLVIMLSACNYSDLIGPGAAGMPTEAVTEIPIITDTPEALFTPTEIFLTPVLPTETPLPSPTAIPSPTGLLAFVSTRDGNYEIYITNPTDGTTIRVTTDPAEDREPVWSPDGRRLAFTSNRNGNWDIYVLDLDGSTLTRITDDPSKDSSPSWSPDGSQIAFESYRDGNPQIFIINSDGTGLRKVENGSLGSSSPSWSPDGDGNILVFTSDRLGNSNLFLINPKGGQPFLLTPDTGGGDSDPTWSPDSQRIAFSSGSMDQQTLFVINRDGSGLSPLTKNSSHIGCIAWSPDNDHIAYCEKRYENKDNEQREIWDIFMVSTISGAQTLLSSNVANEAMVSWSPDGMYLAYQSMEEGNGDIFIILVSSLFTQKLITNSFEFDGMPAWSPVP
jgi:Tol biopolymer transport system component